VSLSISLSGTEDATVQLARSGEKATLWIDGRAYRTALRGAGRAFDLTVEDRVERVWLVVEHDTVYVHAFGRAWELEVYDPAERSLRDAEQQDTVVAPMPGTVVQLLVQEGGTVTSGQPLVVIESMKMQSEMIASRDGVVGRVFRHVGETFDRGEALVELDPEEGDGEED
jgi:acetyl/propionyl-CoA carboxylase alpha subunit